MSTQIRVGIFAILTIVAVFVVWAVLGNFSLRRNAYTIAVHFRNVVGLQVGSSVQVAGVDVGIVDDIKLNGDQTASVICTINGKYTIYRGSTFTVATTLTGQSTLTIFPPPNLATAVPLQRRILPEPEQPEGTVPPTIADLVSEGQKRMKDLDKTLAIVNATLPGVVQRFNGVATHTDLLIVHADKNFNQLGQQLNTTVASVNTLVGSLQPLLVENGRNITAVTGSMKRFIVANGPKIARLVDDLAATADNLNKTMATVASITSDPSVKANLLATTTNLKDSSEKLKAIATDIQSLTGDPKVQSELRGAVQDLSSAIAKADDILGIYSNAQAHGPNQVQAPPAPAAPQSVPTSGSSSHAVRGRGFQIPTLAQAHVRETWGTHGGGPTSDVNLTILPRSVTHVTFGANDLGYHTTYNFMLDVSPSPRLQYSLGVLYSNLGLSTVYRPIGPLGVDARVYDAKHPKLDLYGDLRLSQRLQLFYGERALAGPPALRIPSFGFQFNL